MVYQQETHFIESFTRKEDLEQFISEAVKKSIRAEMPLHNNQINQTMTKTSRYQPQRNNPHSALNKTNSAKKNDLVPLYSWRESITQMNTVLDVIEASPLVKKRKVDPLVFDLTGLGKIKTTPMKKVFNMTGKGSSITGWVDKGMGLLAFDVDNNKTQGKDGRSLLGNFTPIDGNTYKNGFEALRALANKYFISFNKDKLEYFDLKILENNAGLCMLVDGNKLSLTTDLNITEISLIYEELGTNPDRFGNQHRQRSSFVRNGKRELVVDVWFKYTSAIDMPKGRLMMENIKEIQRMTGIAKALGY